MTEDDATKKESENAENPGADKEKRKPSLRAFVDAGRKAEAEAEEWAAIEDAQEPVRSGEQETPPRGTPAEPGERYDTPPRGVPVSEADDSPPPEEQVPPLPEAAPPQREEPKPRSGRLDKAARRRYQEPIELDKVRLDEFGMPLPPGASDRRASPREDTQPVRTVRGERASIKDTRPTRLDPGGMEQTPPHGFPPVPRADTQEHPIPRQSRRERRRKEREARAPRSFFWVAVRILGWGLALSLIGGSVVAGASVFYYIRIVNTVDFPSGPDRFAELRSRALQFETTRIYDQSGHVLHEINDPSGGRRTYVTLDEVSPWVIHATVATEDENFFTNPGFSIPAIVRAVFQAVQEKEVVSGASTITQQLTRALLLPPEERSEQTVKRKIKEIFVSAELSRRFTKEEILELYLNQIYYGNLAYGIEAAAQTYFDKPAKDLNLAEASFLAGIPQAPAVWDPVTNLGDPGDPNAPPGVLDRQEDVVRLMVEAGGDGCVGPMADNTTICVTRDNIRAQAEDFIKIRNTTFEPPSFGARYPHWVVYVQQQLESMFDVKSIYTSGYDVYTTLDPTLQDLAEEQVEAQLSALPPEKNVTSAAVVAIDPRTGAIRAMVGSRDFNDEAIDGQINMAITPRQPGSSIKPVVYLTAFEKGWTPATVIWDVPIEYEIPGFGVYAPINYDDRFHGPQPVRSTLANSYNTPAVQTLDFVGVPAFLQKAHDLGITSLGIVNINLADEAELEAKVPGIDPALAAQIVSYRTLNGDFASVSDILNVPGIDEAKYAEIRSYLRVQEYGLAAALGAGEVPPLEMASAFSAMANGGVRHEPYAIERIELDGEVVFEHAASPGEQAIPADDAYLISDILSDNEARTPAFGANSQLATPFTAAAKTGTTNDFRDNWTVGYHPNLAVAVWVGNPDNEPMNDISGLTGAGPIWRGIMEGALDRYPATDFLPTPTIFTQTVCNDSGTIPSERCLGRTHVEKFSQAHPPPDAEEDIYRELVVDEFTGLIANEFCPDNTVKRSYVVVPDHAKKWLTTDPAGIAWAEERGIEPEEIRDPPKEACDPNTPIPDVAITSPSESEWVQGRVRVRGTADVTNFSSYIVQYGPGKDPDVWLIVQGDTPTPVHDGVLAIWDTRGLQDGAPYTLRVVVFDEKGNEASKTVTVNVAQEGG